MSDPATSAPDSTPPGAVTIVTYNSVGHIGVCLDALAEHARNWDVVVIDNGSTDGSRDVVRARGNARLIDPGRNAGYAGGNNLGMRATRGDFVLILNPDVIIGAGSLEAMRELAVRTAAAAVGANLCDADGEFQTGWAVRRLPTIGYLIADLLLLNRLWPGNPVARYVGMAGFDPARDQRVEQPAGAAIMVRRRVLEELGGMDERFHPLWFEDVDLCWQLRARGDAVWYAAEARMVHEGGHSVRSLDVFQARAYWYANIVRFARKNLPGARARALRVAVVVGALLRGIILAVRPRQLVGQWRLALRAARFSEEARWYE